MRLASILRSSVLSSLLAACAGSEPPPQVASPPPAEPPAAVAPAAPSAPPPPAEPPPPAPTAEAPPPPPAEPPPEEHAKLAGANLSMGSLKADGVVLEGVSCKVDGGLGLLGALVLAAGFSKRKAQIDACSRTQIAKTPVAWTAAGGKIAKIKAEGPDAKVNRCVEKALAGAPAPLPATCLATLVHGKSPP